MIASFVKPSLRPSFAARALSSAADAGSRLVEIREYTLKPEGFMEFLKISETYGDVRKELLPFLGMFTCDIGSCLHKVTHLYSYSSFDERDEIRSKCIKDPRFQQYVQLARPHVQYQENRVMKEAAGLYDTLKMPHTCDFISPPKPTKPATYEWRSYQLKPGHTKVPELITSFSKGLPEKIQADPGGGVPVAFLFTDVGRLNNVVEVWRYPSNQACIKAREAAREVKVWREALLEVGPNVEYFDSSFLRPVSFSNWQ